MTVLMGPTPCAACKRPVTVVRRPVLIHDSAGSNRFSSKDNAVPSEEMREIVVVENDTDHLCRRG